MRAIALLLLSGCMPLAPHYDDRIPGRQNVEMALEGGFPVRGRTTREEVLLKLGEPDNLPESDRVLVYSWNKVVGQFGCDGPMTARYSITLGFDDRGVLSSIRKN